NLYGPIPAIREAVAAADMHIYPDPAQLGLRKAIAAYVGVPVDQVIAGAGSDEIIDLVLRIVEPEAIVTAPPTFGMYRFLAQLVGAKVVEVSRGEGFEIDVAGIERAVQDGASVVFIASPNNPTGNLLPRHCLEALCRMGAL